MKVLEFENAIKNVLSPGMKINNPGGGHSTILKIDDHAITYVRGKSAIRVKFSDMYRAYKHFSGKLVSSSQLRNFAPEVFNSTARPAGHSCNCTFLFSILQAAGLATKLEGRGVRGNPYAVVFK